ncbi:MAG: glycosyltransferase [bacterium]|nr:glycosyltransferase [bacterium]
MKPKLLFVSAISPFPTDSGGSVRTWHTLDNLAKYFSIYFISFKPLAYELNETEKKWLKEKTVFYHFVELIDQRRVGDFFSNGQPFWFTPWYSDEFKLIIRNLIIKEKIEKIQIDFTQLLYLFNYLPKQSQKIFVAHDISTVSFARRAMEAKKIKRRMLFLGLCWQIWWYEKKYLSKYNLVLAMSQNDAQILKEDFNVKNILVIPNGIDQVKRIDKINENNKASFDLGYIGAFSHPPNEEAVKFFITKIAPILEKNNFDYNFYYAGKNDSQKFQQFIKEAQLKQPERIINLGFVEKTEEFYQKTNCLITPIFSGSGTRLKILEALGFGLPVISSTIGAEGINLNSAQLKIANEPKEFYQKIVETKKEIQKNVAYDNCEIMEKYF